MAEKSLKELINPTDKQKEFLKAVDEYKYVLYGGAKGGGKSYILRWTLIKLLIGWAKEYGSVRVGLFCEDFPSLKDRQVTKIQAEFPDWLGRLSESYIEGLSFQLAPQFGGGVIALRNLDDPSKYASSEFAAAAVDELTKNSRDKFDQLRSIIRWPKLENTKFIAGSNPGEIGHAWVKKLFIDRQFSESDPDSKEVMFIRSLPTDNPHLAVSYLTELQKLPDKLRKAYWEGSWDIFEGQYFTEWDERAHVVEPFEILGWKRYRAYDHGRTAPACCKWYAVDYDGRVYVYREYYEKGKDIDEIAKDIKELSAGEEYYFSVADPSIFARTGFRDRYGGQTIAESFARQGVTFLPASNRRIDGWNLLHSYLRHDVNKLPRMVYFSNCTNSIRTMSTLIHDERHPEDLETQGEDHAADCDRYLLLSLHERKTSKPVSELERKLQLMKGTAPNFDFYGY